MTVRVGSSAFSFLVTRYGHGAHLPLRDGHIKGYTMGGFAEGCELPLHLPIRLWLGG